MHGWLLAPKWMRNMLRGTETQCVLKGFQSGPPGFLKRELPRIPLLSNSRRNFRLSTF